MQVMGLCCLKKPNAGKTLTFSTMGRFVYSAARTEPGKQQKLIEGLCSGKCALVDTDSHVLTVVRGSGRTSSAIEMIFAQAGVPFTRCLETLGRRHGGSAMASFPLKQLCHILAGCREELGDALSTGTLEKGLCAQERELLGCHACQRSELHGELDGDRRSCSCKILLLCCLAVEKQG